MMSPQMVEPPTLRTNVAELTHVQNMAGEPLLYAYITLVHLTRTFDSLTSIKLITFVIIWYGTILSNGIAK